MALYDEQCAGPAVFAQAQGDARVNGFNVALGKDARTGDERVVRGYYSLTPQEQAYGYTVGAAPGVAQLYPSNPTPTKFADEWEQWDDISRVTFWPVVGQEANIQYMGAMQQTTFAKPYPAFGSDYTGPRPSVGQIVSNLNQPAQPIGSSDDQILNILMG